MIPFPKSGSASDGEKTASPNLACRRKNDAGIVRLLELSIFHRYRLKVYNSTEVGIGPLGTKTVGLRTPWRSCLLLASGARTRLPSLRETSSSAKTIWGAVSGNQ